MSSENRLGGILAADLVAVADVESLTISGGYLSSCVLATGMSWLALRLAQLRSTVDPQVEESDAGQLLRTQAALLLYDIPSAERSYITLAATKGCLLRVYYANGDVILYGTREWPMHGSLVREPGSTASDGHIYRLSLLSEVPYQGLQ